MNDWQSHGIILAMRSLSKTVCFAVIAASAGFIAPVLAADGPATGGVINWARGNAQATDASCGDFTFKNMKPGVNYSLWVRGPKAGYCRFLAPGLTFRLPPSHGRTIEGSMTYYGFIRFGDEVVVGWAKGY